MKERPILFSAPMVLAILEGRKTQTRRVVNAKHLPWIENSVLNFFDGKWNQRPLPYGQPGDLLWVRESWDFLPDGRDHAQIVYWADGNTEGRDVPAGFNPMIYNRERVRPSIHMPRWASRITLRIKSVRVERLNQISEEDAEREGARRKSIDDVVYVLCSYKHAFKTLWKSINGPDSWSANPWVWVIEFERVE